MDTLKKDISNCKELQEYLYIRGFLLTDKRGLNTEDYPFYNNWQHIDIRKYCLYVHHKQKYYTFSKNDITLVLIGHAYNPFDMIYNEDDILEKLFFKLNLSKNDFLNYFDELTGVFNLLLISDNGDIEIYGDCSGMQACYYGKVKGNLYISTHTQLVGDLCDLTFDKYVKELINYKYYKLYGVFLPGDISPYSELKRVVPNTSVKYLSDKFTVNRFFPRKSLSMATEDNYTEIIKEICRLMNNNMELITKKWNKPAISLTGGMDSKTTLSCANGLYDKFSYFSYISMPGEKIDADAAHNICKALNIEHKIYNIPADKESYNDFNIVKEILKVNIGNIGNSNDNDVCKRIYFADNNDFDVEVKSWVSEIARANYYKKFGKKKMPSQIKPKYLTSMYKVFLGNRKLIKSTDKVFEEYLNKTDFKNHLYNYDWSDMFLWEIRYGSWGGLIITSEHKYSFDITIPYNNRKILELFLSLPLSKRIADIPHEDVILTMNKKISDTGINIVNYNETRKRMYVEKMYFNLSTAFRK